MAAPEFINLTTDGEALSFQLSGGWVSSHSRAIEAEIETYLSKLETRIPLDNAKGANVAKTVTIDCTGVETLDTYGAWHLERLRRSLSVQDFEVAIHGLPPGQHSLFQLVEAVKGAGAARQPLSSLTAFFATVSERLQHFTMDVLSFASMLGAIASAFIRVIAAPSRFRFTSIINQLDKVGWQAVPIIVLITLLIGGIIAQQGFFHFSKLGAELFVVDMVGILVLREVGILLVAIMVAGRSGSAYTAELGSMKMREEIDALSTMGLDPVEVLILPRVLMLVLAVPLLTFIGSMSALYGGGLVAWLYGGMNPEIFIDRLKEAISLTHFKVGMIKAPFMGLVIGVVACAEGLKVKGSAASLGQQTTRSVVKSIFLVIVLDGLFAIFFASIGM